MKNFLKNVMMKKILIVFITIIMVTNFIMPNYVYAAKDKGKDLVSSFFYLLAYVGDAGIALMQKMMKGSWDIKEYGNYAIKYSPGLIFANEVAALDIDFIGAKEEDKDETIEYLSDVSSDAQMDDLIKKVNTEVEKNNIQKEIIGTEKIQNISNKYPISFEAAGYTEKGTFEQTGWNVIKGAGVDYVKEADIDGLFGYENLWDNDVSNMISNECIGEIYFFVYLQEGKLYLYQMELVNNRIDSSGISIISYDAYEYKITRYNISNITDKEVHTVESTAYNLQPMIATWYKALRTIALVGLLSVLLYIGIRIILGSTSAQDKAKYKNMLKDWLVALCILFVLHYIMAFMLNITENLNGIMVNNVVETTTSPTADGGNRADKLMSEIRTNIGNYEELELDRMDVIGYTIMYLVLVILTGIFTVQYLKRVVFMAFLTMIAPMIALTYPLDKIKDGKAQAFSYWLREYIFNCLIQPVHLLLYVVFVSSAMSFATENVLYTIVVLAFMVPAEKIIKEMFGMKSNSPTNTLGAAAGGALVMSMLSKMKGKPPKGSGGDAGSGGSSKPGGVRTATRTPGSGGSSPGNSSPGNSSPGNSSPGNSSPGNSSPGNSSPGNSSPGNSSPGNSTPGNSTPGNSSPGNSSPGSSSPGSSSPGNSTSVGSGKRNIRKGLGTALVGGAKFTARKAGGAAGALAGATIGLAAGVASGDLGKAMQYAGVGGLAGYHGGDNLAQGLANAPKKIKEMGANLGDKWDKATLGQEDYQNKKFDKQFYKSDDYKLIKEDPTISSMYGSPEAIKVVTQQFLDNGITDAGKIREAMQNGITGDDYKLFSDSGVTSVKDIVKLQTEGINSSDMKDFAKAGETNVGRIIDAKKKYAGYTSQQLADRFKLAKHAPKTKKDFKAMMVGRTFDGHKVTNADADALFKELVDFF